jgi:hypothetical protein
LATLPVARGSAGEAGLHQNQEVFMRKCAVLALALLAVFCFSLPSQVSAQWVWVGGGVTLPTGDFADDEGEDHNIGFITVAGLGFDVGPEGLGVFAEGYFGQNKFKDDHHGEKTSPLGVMGGVTYDFAPADPGGLYVFGQAGLMVHRYTSDDFDSDSPKGLAFGGGAGYGFPISSFTGWVEGRYMHGMFSGEEGFEDYNTAFFGVLAGISFPLGGE